MSKTDIKRESAFKLLELINGSERLDNEKRAYRTALFELFPSELLNPFPQEK